MFLQPLVLITVMYNSVNVSTDVNSYTAATNRSPVRSPELV
jgi:hypothetical protein